MPEISCVKRTSVYIKNTRIKQLCNYKLRDFATTFRVQTSQDLREMGPWGPFLEGPEKFLHPVNA